MISKFNSSKAVLSLCLFVGGFSVSNAAEQGNVDSGTQTDHTSASSDRIEFSLEEIAIINALGPWPISVPADPGNEFSGLKWAEKAGERLFRDEDLSGDRTIACISCHQPSLGFGDGLPTAVGKSRHKRNTQTLWNVGLQRWFGWDGGTDSLWSASLRPIFSPIEMDADLATVASRFRSKPYFIDALRSQLPGIDIDSTPDEQLLVYMGKFIGAYLRTLISGETEFDRFRQALLTGDISTQNRYDASARRGLKIFIGEANCHVCHFGANFSNGEFHDTGRPFFTGVGEVDPGRYSGIKRVRGDKYNLVGDYNGVGDAESIRKTSSVKSGQMNFGQWRTPTLRNLVVTGPYMHDGSVTTLRSVVDTYADIDPDRLHSEGESILKPLNMDERARNDLVKFLESLSR
ncbi:MAG: hypothetical protein KTR32_20555 [Granulosicoccus sp.]|nr:hypothetical protein [Granulosicoccus sp.]